MEILKDKIVKAKKEHICCFCNEKIIKGDKYHIQTNVYDGSIYTWKSHLRCDAIASYLKMYDECDEGLTQDEFWEYIRNEFHKLHTEENYDIPVFSKQLDFVCNKYL